MVSLSSENSSEPLVSIGLPVYNGEAFLEQALVSILTQSYVNFELIISDNASADDTAQICESYAAKDRRVHYHRNKVNLGAAGNYNKVFKHSKGKYFKWASHDDLCDRTYLEKCVKVLEADPAIVLCYANTTVISPDGSVKTHYTEDLHLLSPKVTERYRQFHQRFLKKYKCNAVFGVMRKSALEGSGLIGSYEASDITLLAELALLGKVYELSEHLFYRRDHPDMSGRANPTAEAIAAWFDPANGKKRVMPMTRLLIEHARAINRVPMSLSDRIECYSLLRIFLRWKRREISQELKQLATSPITYLS